MMPTNSDVSTLAPQAPTPNPDITPPTTPALVVPITSAPPPSPAPSKARKGSLRTVPTWLIQDHLLRRLNENQYFATDLDRTSLYRYQPSGIYVEDADAWIADRAWEIMTNLPRQQDWRGHWSTTLLRNIRSAMRAKRPILPLRPPAGQVNLLNGILDLNTLSYIPHSPSHLWTVQVPISYDPSATCPAWDSYLSSIFEDDVLPLAEEIFGAALTSDRITEEAIWLIADGGNGKSTFLEMLTNFLGPQNVSHLSVQDIHNGGFSLSELNNRLLNIDDDATYAKLKDPANLKKIIASSPIRVDVKYKEGYTMYPFCKMLIAANAPPDSTDQSLGWTRRNLYLKMSKFDVSHAPRRTKEAIWASLSTPSELSGMLNRAIAGWKRFTSQREFSKPASMMEHTQEIRDQQSPVDEFIATYLEYDPGSPDFLGTRQLAHQINHFLKVYGAEKMSDYVVRQRIERVWPELAKIPSRNKPIPLPDGSRRRGFMGLRSSYDFSEDLSVDS